MTILTDTGDLVCSGCGHLLNTIELNNIETVLRLRRERLEEGEGTPRAEMLLKLQACEFGVTTLVDAAKLGADEVALDTLSDDLYRLLNEVYLHVSPETAFEKKDPTATLAPYLS